MISLISWFEIINIILPDPNIFLWTAASAADAAAGNPSGIKMFLANGSIIFHFLLKAIQLLVMVLKVYLKIILIINFFVFEFLIVILYWQINHLEKLEEFSRLVY